MEFKDWKKLKIPEKPGVYFFQKGREILYIGKATSLRDRTKSYLPAGRQVFLSNNRGPIISQMVEKADTIKWQETDTVLEALILEANLIKKYKPLYNTKEKDDKSFLCAVITDEEIPRVLTVRKKDIDFTYLKTRPNGLLAGRASNYKLKTIFGPFTSGTSLKEALRIIRKIFPFHDGVSMNKYGTEFYKQIGLSPETYGDDMKKEYQSNIKNIKLFFEGKKKTILKNLEKDMKSLAKKKEFEKAGEVKKKIFALTHINDIALLKRDDLDTKYNLPNTTYRIEAYDVAHMSGKNMVGVMTVVENGIVSKSEYRKFKIKSFKDANDPGALLEVLTRRLGHAEWRLPDLIVVDGNEVQKSVTELVLKEKKLDIDVVSVVKDSRHKAREILGKKGIIEKHKLEILLANAEAHRFAITYHRQKRAKDFLKQ